MNNTVETSKKIFFDYMHDVDEALIDVEMLPDIVQVFIENYKLDNLERTDGERCDLGDVGGKLYSLLTLVERTIWTAIEKKEAAYDRYKKSSESTATTTETTK